MKMKETNPQKKKDSLTGKLLRLLRTNRGFEEPSGVQEKIVGAGVSGNNYYNYRKEIEIARLEAERKKAEGLMEWQKRCFIC
jgi:hypothetical protein